MRSALIQSVARAMALINCMAEVPHPLSLQEISQRAGLPKSTVHGLLSTLREFAMVEQSALDGRYRLGVRLFELGNIVSRSWDILTIARPHLHRIAHRLGESVDLALLEDGEVLTIDHADAGAMLQVVTTVGARIPCHCCALGKALLSHRLQAECEGIFRSRGMYAFTPHTVTRVNALLEDLAEVRNRGYAVGNGEFRIGMRDVAAPVLDMQGVSRYALGVTGMFRRVTDDLFVQAQQLVMEAARAISYELGYRTPCQ